MRRHLLLAALALALACPDIPATTSASDPTSASETLETTADPTVSTSAGPDPTSTSSSTSADTTSTSAASSDTTASPGTTSSGSLDPVCGDGHLDPGEACDDGDADDADGCRPDCTLGPGVPATVIPLPQLPLESHRRCLAGIDAAQLGADDHAFLIGGWQHGVDQLTAARVSLVTLPDGEPSSWNYLEHAAPFSRFALQAATAANGDVIVAGFISTEAVHVDSGGFLWLARFAPDGAIMWDREFPALGMYTVDLALTPEEDIFVAGVSYTLSAVSTAHRFDGAGTLEWSFTEPLTEEHYTGYRGVAVDAHGSLYVAATRRPFDGAPERVFVRALTADAVPLWELDVPAPAHPFVDVADIEHTAEDRLIVALAQADDHLFDTASSFGLVTLDLDGVQQSWIDWSPGPGLRPFPAVVVADPTGGVYVAGTARAGDDLSALALRFGADGQLAWTNLHPDAAVADATLGPDDRLWVLDQHQLRAHLP